MSKSTLRKQVLQDLRNMSQDQRQAYQNQMFDFLISYLADHHLQKIGLFWGQQPEIETWDLSLRLLKQGFLVYLVRMETGRQLSFRSFTDLEDLEETSSAIVQPQAKCPRIEPSDLDLILVPGLLFMPSGYRIGFGGGYYDRLLAKYPECQTLSLAFPNQMMEEGAWLIENHDRPVQKIISINEEGGTSIFERLKK